MVTGCTHSFPRPWSYRYERLHGDGSDVETQQQKLKELEAARSSLMSHGAGYCRMHN
jgi:hypothetical protein